MTVEILTWEAYALIQIAQALGWKITSFAGESGELASLAQTRHIIPALADLSISVAVEDVPFAEAYREVDKSALPYVVVLAQRLTCELRSPMSPVKFKDLPTPCRPKGIIVCPFPSHGDLFLPAQIWNYIIRLLRSYGLPVYFMGDRDSRMDSGIFTEGEVLSNLPVKQKLAILKDAALVVGPPSAWTSIALGFGTSLIASYPIAIPEERWFPAVPKEQFTYGRIIYSPYSLDVAGFIATMRMIIKEMK